MSPKTILLLRHAEKPADPKDPGLAPAGTARAQALATWIPQILTQKPDFIFASALSRHSARPYDTMRPLSASTGVPIDATFADQDYEALASDLFSDARYEGAVVTICWHHGFIPEFAAALGAPAGSYPAKWKGDVFNLALLFTYSGGQAPNVQDLTQPF